LLIGCGLHRNLQIPQPLHLHLQTLNLLSEPRRLSGARNVYAKFDGYLPRDGVASFFAGPRVAYFDRVEWLTVPDPATQVAALRRGEVDWVEQPVMDLVPSRRKDANLKVEVVETTGLIGCLRFNQLFPPFDNPAIRRAALKAVNQTDFMAAVAGEADPGVYQLSE